MGNYSFPDAFYFLINQLSYSRHVEIHTLPYRCDFQGCENAEATVKDLNRHKAKHQKIQLYFCPVEGCLWHVNGPKGGLRWDDAKRHLKSHPNLSVDAPVLVRNTGSSGLNLFALKESDESGSDYSITSLMSFTPSTMASSATSISDMEPLARDSVAEISHLISNDDELQKLLEKAFCFIDPERVTRNFRRILRTFSQDLMNETTTLLQEQAAKFVGLKSRQIAVLVRENVIPSKLLILPDHNIDSVREQRLQDYLKERSPQLDSIPDISFAPVMTLVKDDDSDMEGDNEDPTEYPDLTKLKGWFLSANAMQNLRENFRLFLSPAKVATADSAGEPASSSLISSPNSDVNSDVEGGKTKNATIAKIAKTVQIFKKPMMLALFQTASRVWNDFNAKKALEPGLVRLKWTCVGACYCSMDIFSSSLSISDCL
jgi:hypothetical protein